MQIFAFLLLQRKYTGISAITRHKTPVPVYMYPYSVTAVVITLVMHVNYVSHTEGSKVGKEKEDEEQKYNLTFQVET